MKYEPNNYDEDNLAAIWQRAQNRRTEDMYFWFNNFSDRQRQLKSSASRLQYPQRRAAALVWKLLKATHAV